MILHNAHVVKWYRWRIWLARQTCRPFAETVLIGWHNEEFAKGAALIFTKHRDGWNCYLRNVGGMCGLGATPADAWVDWKRMTNQQT